MRGQTAAVYTPLTPQSPAQIVMVLRVNWGGLQLPMDQARNYAAVLASGRSASGRQGGGGRAHESSTVHTFWRSPALELRGRRLELTDVVHELVLEGRESDGTFAGGVVEAWNVPLSVDTPFRQVEERPWNFFLPFGLTLL